jgi:type II secretory ATPase GspE/PulE/Tfp pilus assembly ATPase PilB-like protein
LEALVHQAQTAGASDIHLQKVGPIIEVAFRLDGALSPRTTFSDEIADRIFGRIKYLARLKTYQESLPQDGRIDHKDIGAARDIRVSTYPTVTGEKIVLRLFQESPVQTLADLGLPDPVTRELEAFLHRPAGLLLLTGPAGSGKTTTIHACLRHLSRQGQRHIITIEDPVEQIIPGIMQTEIKEEAGLTFAKAARHLLRQDPEVLVVGEIRDEETAQLVVRASVTGHLLIATLHAGSCRGVLDRLFTFCPDQSASLAALELIVNQRLMRRLCPACQGRGCAKCLQTGYHGRMAVAECFRIDASCRTALRQGNMEVILPQPTLAQAARQRVDQQATNLAEYHRLFES